MKSISKSYRARVLNSMQGSVKQYNKQLNIEYFILFVSLLISNVYLNMIANHLFGMNNNNVIVQNYIYLNGAKDYYVGIASDKYANYFHQQCLKDPLKLSNNTLTDVKESQSSSLYFIGRQDIKDFFKFGWVYSYMMGASGLIKMYKLFSNKLDEIRQGYKNEIQDEFIEWLFSLNVSYIQSFMDNLEPKKLDVKLFNHHFWRSTYKQWGREMIEVIADKKITEIHRRGLFDPSKYKLMFKSYKVICSKNSFKIRIGDKMFIPSMIKENKTLNSSFKSSL